MSRTVLVPLVTIALLLPGCAFLQKVLGQPGETAVVPTSPVRLDGALLRAISIATTDLISRREEALSRAPEPSEILRCFTRLENYDVRVQEMDDRYIVAVLPVAERCVGPENLVFGGTGSYEISKADFSILRKEQGE